MVHKKRKADFFGSIFINASCSSCQNTSISTNFAKVIVTSIDKDILLKLFLKCHLLKKIHCIVQSSDDKLVRPVDK